jgi:hypothetical protein
MSNINQTITLDVDKTQFIAKLGGAFASKLSVVRELIQNARRAGSPVVNISWDATAKKLVVADEGDGITDFQKLFTVAQTGWSEDMQQQEAPWGTGFMSAVYAAKEIEIVSNGIALKAKTADILNFSSIETVPVPATPGTSVTLIDVDLPDLVRDIEDMVQAYPIPVFFNGKELPRPFAEKAEHLDLRWVETNIGTIGVYGEEGINDTSDFDSVLYLQGFEVARTKAAFRYTKNVNRVHLDPKKFTAVYPDRDRLKDEEEAFSAVKRALITVFKQAIQDAKSSFGHKEFVMNFWGLAKRIGYLEVMNDVEWLPPSAILEVQDYPSSMDLAEYARPVDSPMSKKDIEGCRILDIAVLGEEFDADGYDHQKMLWMLAYSLGWKLLKDELPEGHWIHRVSSFVPYRNVDSDANVFNAKIELNGVGKSGYLESSFVYCSVQLCDSFTIRSDLGTAEFHTDAIGLSEGIFIPAGETSQYVVTQAGRFINEWGDVLSDEVEQAECDLAQVISKLSADSPDSLAAFALGASLRDCADLHNHVVLVSCVDRQVEAKVIPISLPADIPPAVLAEIQANIASVLQRHASAAS